MAHKFTWNDELDAELRRIRAEGHGWAEVADQMGIGFATALRRGRTLGISQRIAWGRHRGVDVVAQRDMGMKP